MVSELDRAITETMPRPRTHYPRWAPPLTTLFLTIFSVFLRLFPITATGTLATFPADDPTILLALCQSTRIRRSLPHNASRTLSLTCPTRPIHCTQHDPVPQVSSPSDMLWEKTPFCTMFRSILCCFQVQFELRFWALCITFMSVLYCCKELSASHYPFYRHVSQSCVPWVVRFNHCFPCLCLFMMISPLSSLNNFGSLLTLLWSFQM